MDHYRRRSVGEPSRRQNQSHRQDAALVIFHGLQHQQEQQRHQAGGQQLRERASPIHDHQMIRIDRVKHGREDRVASSQPPPGQKKHRRSRRHQYDPQVNTGGQSPGEDRAQAGSQRPRGRWIKDKSRLAVGEVRQRSPSRINDSMLPLPQNFQPRIQMKLDIVAQTACPEKKKGISTANAAIPIDSNGVHEKRVLSSRLFRTRSASGCRCFAQILPRVTRNQLTITRKLSQSTFNLDLFNPELTLLKSRRNAVPLT